MTGLREFKLLDPTRHNPAVGIRYGESPLGKLLIVGMSHYGKECDVRQPQFTYNVIGAMISGECNISYFTTIAHLFRCEPREFYSLIAFYNFLPESFTGPKQPVTPEQLLNPDTHRFFFRVIDELKPSRVLITGERVWRYLPCEFSGNRRVRDDGTGLSVRFGSGVEAECCWYSVADGSDCLVGAITHPSTPKFSKYRRDISNWIQEFMGVPLPKQ